MPAEIPQPVVDSDSRPYWEGLARGELLIQRCAACQHNVFYPRSICPHCFSDQLSWIKASGKGIIYSYTVAHTAFGVFAADAPFVIAIVELAEGVRMMTRLVDAPREQIAVGKAVQVTFVSLSEEVTLPYFKLVE